MDPLYLLLGCVATHMSPHFCSSSTSTEGVVTFCSIFLNTRCHYSDKTFMSALLYNENKLKLEAKSHFFQTVAILSSV